MSDKVFCNECKYFSKDFLCDAICEHPDNIKINEILYNETYGYKAFIEKSIEYINTPKQINSTNNCENFKNDNSNFWFYGSVITFLVIISVIELFKEF